MDASPKSLRPAGTTASKLTCLSALSTRLNCASTSSRGGNQGIQSPLLPRWGGGLVVIFYEVSSSGDTMMVGNETPQRKRKNNSRPKRKGSHGNTTSANTTCDQDSGAISASPAMTMKSRSGIKKYHKTAIIIFN